MPYMGMSTQYVGPEKWVPEAIAEQEAYLASWRAERRARTEWAVYQYSPGLPAEGDSPEIPAEPPVVLARGFVTAEEAAEAIDQRFGDRFDVGVDTVSR